MQIKAGHCKQCGKCCEYTYGYAYLSKEEDTNPDIEFRKCQGAVFAKYGENKWTDFLYVATPLKRCSNLKRKDGKCFCKLHGTSKQSTVCRDWPFSGEQHYYQAVNTVFGCGYFFIDIDVECPQPLA